MTKEKWSDFTKNDIASSMYISCLNPKTQQKVAEFIYRKNPRSVNQGPIIECRKKYANYAFEISIHGNSIHNFKITSKADPFLDYVKVKLIKRGETSKKRSYDVFSEKEISILKKMFDSKWFRSSFFQDLLINGDCETIHPYNISRDKQDGRLMVRNAMECIGKLLETIATITSVFHMHHKIGDSIPSISDIKPSEDFDQFAKRWYDKSFLNNKYANMVITNTFVLSCESLGNYVTTNKILKAIHDSKYFLCIPKELLDKLTRIERIELTIFLHFSGNMEKALTYNKLYQFDSNAVKL